MSPSGPLSTAEERIDSSAIDQVLGGDQSAFEILMRRYNQRLFRVARAIAKNDAEAEDVVQQTYLAAYSNLGQFRGEAQFSTWITRIAVHEALRRTRKQVREAGLKLADLRLVQGSPEGRSENPEDAAANRKLRELLESAIDTLPESNRVVFVMRDVQEMTTKEVAECLDLSEEAVRVRLHRARASLRETLFERAGSRAADAFSFAGERCDRIVAFVLQRLSTVTVPAPS